MILFLFLLALAICISSQLVKDNAAHALSVEQSQAIKGVFVITVFFSHFCSYVVFDKWYDALMLKYCHWLGQLMVVPFLFYSGYGIFESVKKKGLSYVDKFPKKRILKILLHFDMAVVIFVVYDIFAAPEKLSILKVLLSFIAWESVGNSNWFIFAILCAYLFTYISLHFFRNNLLKAVVFIGVLCFLYVVIVSRFKPGYWFDTILSFPLGCAVSLYKEKLFVKNYVVWFCLCVMSFFVLVAINYDLISNFYIRSQIAMIAMSALILLLSMRVKVKSKVLSWFGANVFGIYILQRLPMNFGKYMNWNEQSIYFYFIFCFSVTLLLSFCFNKMTMLIDSKLFKDK